MRTLAVYLAKVWVVASAHAEGTDHPVYVAVGWLLSRLLCSGDKAVEAARKGDLPKPLLLEIAKARRYAEGTAVRVVIRSHENLEVVKKLATIKLQN